MWHVLKSLSNSGEFLMALSVLGIQQELQRVLERAGANGLSGNFHFACKAKRLYGIYQPTAIGVL